MFAQPVDENKFVWTQGVENNLLLNISVGSQPETLELNGVRFYPPVMTTEGEEQVPYIAQVPASASLVDIKSDPEKYLANPLRLTSWSFQAGSSRTVDTSGKELLTIHLQLNALSLKPINTPEVKILALKDEEGKLIILKVDTKGPQHAPKECHDWPLLCKWRAIIASKLHGFKGFKNMKPHGCHRGHKGMKEGGMRPPHAINGPPSTNMHHGPDSHHDGAGAMEFHHGHRRPHHGGHRHGGHRHHRHHKVGRIFHVIGRVMLTVFVPILLGVAAGMITYLLGMFIGAMVAFVWTKVRPASRYQAVALSEDDEETPRNSMEKAGFADEEKALVEEPPVYAEVEGKEVTKD